MTDLLKIVYANKSAIGNYTPKSVLVCTHATFSTRKLLSILTKDIANIYFYPVGYSKNSSELEEIKNINVKIIDDENDLIDIIPTIDVVIEDGARVSKIIDKHNLSSVLRSDFFSIEQTSGGIRYFNENKHSYPIVDVAFSPLKLDIENRRATPESVINIFSQITGQTLGAKNVLIIGFGSIGEGLARYARILGANVVIYDSSDLKCLFAKHRGYKTIEKSRLYHSISDIDVVFTATNRYLGDIIDGKFIKLLKNGALLCNAGSGTGEFDPKLLEEGEFSKHQAQIKIHKDELFSFIEITKNNEKKIIKIISHGYPINLHLGKGTSDDAISVVMSMLYLALIKGPAGLSSGINPLPNNIQEFIARLLLKNNQNEIMPTYINSSSLIEQTRPYGGVSPFHNEINDVANFSIVKARFRNGSKTLGHYHKRSQEAYYGLSGEADIITWHKDGIDNKISFNIKKGEYLLIPEDYFHDVVVKSIEDFECLVIASPPFVIWDQFFGVI